MTNETRNKFVELLKDTLHEWECDVQPETVLQIAEHLIENDVNVPPCKVGDEIWVVETEGGEAVDITCYMFLAKSKGCIIATSWINDYDIDETIEYHINETQENLDTDLAVFSEEYCFATKEKAEQKLKEMRGE